MTHPHVCPTCHQPTTATALKDVVALRLIQHWATDTICATLTPELTGMHEAILVEADGAETVTAESKDAMAQAIVAHVIDALNSRQSPPAS